MLAGIARRGAGPARCLSTRPANQKAVEDMRANYTKGSLDESNAGDDPLRLFQRWFDKAVAAKLLEPNALTLSTVDAATMQPSSRVVLLKGFDESGFTFYTNYAGRKARELAATPKAAMNFLWLPLERQVRIEGTISKVGAAETEAYFRSRPRASQIGAWASRQSAVVGSAAELSDREAELDRRFEGRDVPLPDFWGGYRLRPTMIEFWQGKQSRLHDRIAFRAADAGAWTRERLAP